MEPKHISQALQKMELQSQALQRQELRQPKNGEDAQMLSCCLRETRIAHLPGPEPIKEALRYAMVLVGLRAPNWPGDAEKLLLLNYIQKNYGGHTASEIRLAFEMAVGGKLSCEANCYENFSVLYFAEVMHAYRAWASEAVKSLPETEMPLLPASEVSDKEFIDAVFNLYKINQDFKQIPELAYKILEPSLSLTLDDKRRIQRKVFEITGACAKGLCRAYAVKEYFDKPKDN